MLSHMGFSIFGFGMSWFRLAWLLYTLWYFHIYKTRFHAKPLDYDRKNKLMLWLVGLPLLIFLSINPFIVRDGTIQFLLVAIVTGLQVLHFLGNFTFQLLDNEPKFHDCISFDSRGSSWVSTYHISSGREAFQRVVGSYYLHFMLGLGINIFCLFFVPLKPW